MSPPARRTIDTAALYQAVDRKRQRLNMSWRAAVLQITGGQNPTLPGRLRDGGPITADMLGSILMWLDDYDVRHYLIALRKGRRYSVTPDGDVSSLPGGTCR